MNLQKPKKYRSKRLTQSAKGNSCTFRIPGVCNHDNSTVVFCHAPSSMKGAGTKSDDFWGADGCSACHYFVDNDVSGGTQKVYFYDAIIETLRRRFDDGLIKLV